MEKYLRFTKKCIFVLLVCFLTIVFTIKNNKVAAQASFNITIQNSLCLFSYCFLIFTECIEGFP